MVSYFFQVLFFPFDKHVPAVGELPAHLLEVVVAHVVDIEDNAVLVLGNLVANVLEELILLLTGLLGDLGEVDDL